jgi:hypothetical protein
MQIQTQSCGSGIGCGRSILRESAGACPYRANRMVVQDAKHSDSDIYVNILETKHRVSSSASVHHVVMLISFQFPGELFT